MLTSPDNNAPECAPPRASPRSLLAEEIFQIRLAWRLACGTDCGGHVDSPGHGVCHDCWTARGVRTVCCAFAPNRVRVLGTSRTWLSDRLPWTACWWPQADGIAVAGTEHYIALALLLALMMGMLQWVMGLLRLGFLVNFLSDLSSGIHKCRRAHHRSESTSSHAWSFEGGKHPVARSSLRLC